MNQPRIALLEEMRRRCEFVRGGEPKTPEERIQMLSWVLDDLIAALLRNEV